MLLKLIKTWNSLVFTRPLLGRASQESIEFYIDTSFGTIGSEFQAALDKCISGYSSPGKLVYVGNCTNIQFENMEEVSFQIEDARFKRYRLYFFEKKIKDPENLNSRIADIEQKIILFTEEQMKT